MGVDFQDYDNDGRPDVSIVALAGETFSLFHNEGGGLFRDATYTSGLAKASARHSGWSPVFADFNNDGLKDLFITRSHVNDRIEEMEASHYKETNMRRGGALQPAPTPLRWPLSGSPRQLLAARSGCAASWRRTPDRKSTRLNSSHLGI